MFNLKFLKSLKDSINPKVNLLKFSESQRFANDQTQAMYITENAGFGKIYDEASAVLEID